MGAALVERRRRAQVVRGQRVDDDDGDVVAHALRAQRQLHLHAHASLLSACQDRWSVKPWSS